MERSSEPRRILRLIEQRPDDAELLQTLGRWYRRRGRNAEALDAWERSLQLDPCDPYTHLFLGNLYYKEQDWSSAMERFTYAEMLAPENPAPLWCIADVFEVLDRQDLAEKYLSGRSRSIPKTSRRFG